MLDPIAEAGRQWSARGWDDATPGMLAVTSIMRAQAIVQARVDAVLRPLGLTFARYELLQLLSFTREGSLPMTKAGALLQVHPASVTNAAQRLEAAELVARRPSPSDGRVVVVSITDEGRRVAAKATDALNAEVFTRPGLAPDRVQDLIAVLRELRADAGDIQ
ncbi:DNA-binding transcriptional regulator, MarR family [Klenkia marina]|uniref:DNA-binding transcriptional regulator, MarR family n=1 Tax=Klenkia marina TaxID=1960309 RepID=A0A1G4XUX7_9ACTN|nr:MarR family transcriptional regulator [Klenkia marina]SCX44840.1 DNA-binding transcriptional regulator, MarR family [Klenkia marina]